jgi:UPF0755 protein
MTGPVGARGQRQGSVSAREIRGETRSRRGSSWGGVAFVALVVVVIVVGSLVLLAPVYREFAFNAARDNPATLRLPFAADIVRERLGTQLRTPAGTEDRSVAFRVEPGQSIVQVGEALVAAGLISDPRVFIYHVISRNLDDQVQVGGFELNETMTPLEIAQRLAQPPDPPKRQVVVKLRQSLRLEQIAAYLQTIGLDMDVRAFYELTQSPPQSIIDDYPMLKELPRGRSLEGFMGRGTFSVDQDITPNEMVRELLDRRLAEVPMSVIQEAKAAGLDFYEVLTLASIVERETPLDSERAKIAGVYLNRLDPQRNPTRIMNADPTVIYASDTRRLRERAFEDWDKYLFWGALGQALRNVKVPPGFESFQTYVNPGPPIGPIASPTLPSIQAVIKPDRKDGYLYFFACDTDRKNTHQFARTLAEQERNIARCR